MSRVQTLDEHRASLKPVSAGVIVGLDLGQSADPTALAICEQWAAPGDRPSERSYHVGHLERLPLGTSYPGVVERVREVMRRPQLVRRFPKRWVDDDSLDGPGRVIPPAVIRPQLVVDATGVGRPVVDMLRQAGLAPVAITITSGDQATFARGPGGGSWRVPKRDLVGVLMVLLQTGRLKVAATLPHAATLADELLRFRVKIDPVTAHDSYGAEWRVGAHDDLVLALACAVWWGQRRPATGTLSFPVIQI